jgi:hypothetical protein
VSLSASSSALEGGQLVQRLGALTSTYEVTAGGLEQRFQINGPPLAGTAKLAVALSSPEHWQVAGEGSSIAPKEAASGHLSYGGLRSTDATGRVLSSHFVVGPGGVQIVVDSSHANYPVTIDPTWSSSSNPTSALTNGTGDYLGFSVAISSDGTTALVGAPGVDNEGAAYVFHSSAESSWSSSSTPTATLTNGAGSAGDDLGIRIAISSDGTTALVGALGVSNGRGAVDVFHSSSESSWSSSSTPTATLTDGAGAADDSLGSSVAISSDGTTGLVGAAGVNSYTGAAYIFRASSESSWSSTSAPTATLTDGAGAVEDSLGFSVAISSDGTTALVGALGVSNGRGAVDVFHSSSESSWSSSSTPTATLTDGAGAADDSLGSSVAISSDGTTALVGAFGVSNNEGAAYVFHSSSESSWSSSSTPTATLTDGSGAADDSFGSSVAISSDGTAALVGAAGTNNATGAAYVFQASAESSWSSISTPNATLTDGSGAAADYLGFSIAISSDGTTAFVGAFGVNSYRGAAYVFQASSESSWSSTSAPPATLTSGLGDYLGYSVAVSSDGTTALVGAPAANGGRGAAYIFQATSESSWSSTSTPTATLTNGSGAVGDSLGLSAAISSDGTTALVGTFTVNGDRGAAYVFRATSESSWSSTSTPTATLTDGSGAADDSLGSSVAISSDGTTALLGASGVNGNTGAAYVFRATSESSWSSSTTPTATLTNGSGAAHDSLGSSVAISSDGTTALVGAAGVNSYTGAAYVFQATSESSWSSTSAPTATLTNGSGAANDSLGVSVAISSDGTTALVGAWGVNNYTGAAYVFQATSESSWSSTSAPTATLTDGSGAANDSLGGSVAISSDGTTALVGAQGVNGYTGAAYVFQATSESSWSSTSVPTATLTDGSGAANDSLGDSLAISSDDTTALVGAYGVDDNAGAAYVFTLTVTAPSAPPAPTLTPTTTSLVSSANPATTGQEVTYTATVTPNPGGGSVGFTDNGTTISGCGSVPVNTTSPEAVCDFIYQKPGDHTIGAIYSGGSGFASSSAQTISEVVKPGVVRVFGQDAIATAIAISQAQFPEAGSAGAVVLARSDFFSDALAGGPLASTLHGPLLVTPGAPSGSSLDPRVLSEIQRVLPIGGTVYVLGGDLALSPDIDVTLEGLGYVVVREAGADEYATAVDVAEQLGNPTIVFEVTGLSFYDSVSAVPAAVVSKGAILLTDGTAQAPETAAYLAAHPGDLRYAIGGPLAAAGADPSATAVYGQDLYGTSAAVATHFFAHSTTFGAATSATFSDALCAGPVLGSEDAPMLLVPSSGVLPATIEQYLSGVASGLDGGTLYGGPLAVGDDVLAELNSAI